MGFEGVDKLMHSAMSQGVFPGAVLLIAREGEVVFHHAYGWADLFSRRAMTRNTYFDLASLTKPLATTLAVMDLVQQGRLDLDRPCADYCPSLDGTEKAGITLRQLLSHRAGLIAWRPYYTRLRRLPRDQRTSQLRQWLRWEPLSNRPGEREEYSDLGFLLLQWIIEAQIGSSLPAYVEEMLYSPLGLEQLQFATKTRKIDTLRTAATELCPWRGRLLVGEVHDDNAAALGGATGHAGLFGTAQAVYLLLEELLLSEQDSGHRSVIDGQVVRTFFHRQPQTDWALGFDTPSQEGSSAGTLFGKESVGHQGFTGTSFWMDRRQAVTVVLLTNRVHPTRYNLAIRAFRPRLHDAAMTALGRS
jgi:CubicO group peptidase (beta-lactamase class C family)